MLLVERCIIAGVFFCFSVGWRIRLSVSGCFWLGFQDLGSGMCCVPGWVNEIGGVLVRLGMDSAIGRQLIRICFRYNVGYCIDVGFVNTKS